MQSRHVEDGNCVSKMDKWLDPFHDGPQIGPRVQDGRSSSVPVGAFNVTQQQGLAFKSSYPSTPVIFSSRNQAGWADQRGTAG